MKPVANEAETVVSPRDAVAAEFAIRFANVFNRLCGAIKGVKPGKLKVIAVRIDAVLERTRPRC